MPPQKDKNLSFKMSKQLRAARAKEFALVSGGWQYRNREDQTLLKPNVMVAGSQNVLTKTTGRLGIVPGYSLDGPAASIMQGCMSSFDWRTAKGYQRILRAGGLTSNDGKLQFRYVDSNGNVSWLDLMTGLSSVKFNFADFWDYNTEKIALLLMVNGTDQIFEWSGAVSTVKSVTSNTITVNDTLSLGELGFLASNVAGPTQITVGGVDYTYTALGSSPNTIFNHTGDLNNLAIIPAQLASQLFTTGPNSQQIIDVVAKIYNSDAASRVTTVNAEIWTDNAGVPGTKVGQRVSVQNTDASMGEKTLTFTFNQAVSPNTNYHIVLNSDDWKAAYNIRVGASAGVGANYQAGGAWTATNGYLNLIIRENTVTPQTFTGVTPDPTIANPAAGTVLFQKVRVNKNKAMSGLPLPKNDLIEVLNNQVYVGCLTVNDVYVSKANNFRDYTFSSPRKPGDGAIFNLGSTPVAFVVQEEAMYLSGIDEWYKTKFTPSADLSSETLTIEKLKTSSYQSAQSQALVTKDKNSVVFLSTEPVLSTLGRVDNNFLVPQMTDLSYGIINDMNAYDFTDGCAFYYKNYLLVSVPKHGLVRIYNQTDPKHMYWEAPVTYPVSRFSIINGSLYGHSYYSLESYKLFDGTSFNGQPIPAIAVFAYQSYGSRHALKDFNQFYTEGYINQNTTLNIGIRKELDGCATDAQFSIAGNSNIVCIGGSDAPLGKDSIGKNPFGADTESSSLPPNFAVITTMNATPNFRQAQISFFNSDVDQQWELLAFGPAINMSNDIPTQIKQ